MHWLLALVPIAAVLEHVAPEQPLWIYIASALAIVPLADRFGRVTEEIAARTSEGIGALRSQ